MAGYKYNYRTNQPPEYSNVPNADSTNGRIGTNTPGAKQNQQTPPEPTGDAWSMFANAAAQWRRPAPAPAVQPTTTPAPQPTANGYTPAALAGVIQGRYAPTPVIFGGMPIGGREAPAPTTMPAGGMPPGQGEGWAAPSPVLFGGMPVGGRAAPYSGTGFTIGNEGGNAGPYSGYNFNPSMARRDRNQDGNPTPPAPVTPPSPSVPPPPVTPPPSGPRVAAPNPLFDPTTPATLAGIIQGQQGGPMTGTGGQTGGNVPPPPLGATRGNGGGLTAGSGPVPVSTPIPGTENWGEFEKGKLAEYINGGYYFLKDNPGMLLAYWGDQGRTGEKGVDLPDWLAAQYPTIDWSQVPENARPGRMGYDTWRLDENGNPRGLAPTSGPTQTAGNYRGAPVASPWIANAPGAPTSGLPYGADRAIQGQADAAWQAAEEAKKKAAEAAAPSATHPPVANDPNMGATVPTVPPTNGTPAGPSPATPPSTTPPPLAPFGPGVTGGAGDYISRLLDPLHQQQQQELMRVLRQQGANEGTINSGAFGDVVGKAEGSLIAQQGAQKASFITDAENRALQKYGIDQNKIVAEMQDATTRFGIQTNADLERWLNSADSNTLNKYGIDKNDLLARYKADLEASGQKYSADQQVNAARLSAGAAHAAAGAAASAAMREAELRYQLGVQQLQQSGSQFNQQNMLDWASLQAGLYNNDANRQLGWGTLAAQLGMTPAQLAALLQGYQPPAPVYNAP